MNLDQNHKVLRAFSHEFHVLVSSEQTGGTFGQEFLASV